MAPPSDDAGDDPVDWPPGITSADVEALDQLAAAGWGEGDGVDHHVPPDLLELHEVMEWQAAVARERGQ